MKAAQNKAFTIAELIIAMSILAMLLAAVAGAVHSSFHGYDENTKIADASQTVRAAVERIARDVRTATAVNTTSSTITIIPPDDGSGLEQIQYDYTGSTLVYRRTVSGQTTSSDLLGTGDNITIIAFTVTREMGQDWQGLDCTKSITAYLSFTIDNQTTETTFSAAPRRNQLY
ncbi:MAG: prepilin-type N-terminal cleavage/methylation domain-containing protein [Planctomycetota bacterium]|nr:prepilin-type N-terminal cleavage/methylation domain-containing protein [Planctomycetota bacterium]